MNYKETVQEVIRLLEMLPGTEIVRQAESSKSVWFMLQILDLQSVSILAHIAVWTNTPFDLEIDWKCTCNHQAPECVRYELRVPLFQDQDVPFEQLRHVGGFLAVAHYKNDRMESEEAKRLTSAMNLHPGFLKK